MGFSLGGTLGGALGGFMLGGPAGAFAGGALGGLFGDELVPDMGGAADAAEFKPYNIQSSYGDLAFDPATRTFTSSLDPGLARLQSSYRSRLGSVSPAQELSLFRQQAAPYNEAAALNLENRLFSQGRLDHSQVYQPGGAMRGLFDAQAQQDLAFQQQAISNAMAREAQLYNQYTGLFAPEQSLFNMGMGMGNIGMQGQLQQSQLRGQEAQYMPNLMSSLLGGGLMGFMMR